MASPVSSVKKATSKKTAAPKTAAQSTVKSSAKPKAKPATKATVQSTVKSSAPATKKTAKKQTPVQSKKSLTIKKVKAKAAGKTEQFDLSEFFTPNMDFGLASESSNTPVSVE